MGTLLVVVEGNYKVVVGSLVAVHVQQQVEGMEAAHSLVVVALTDMAEVLESMVVEDQLFIKTNKQKSPKINNTTKQNKK